MISFRNLSIPKKIVTISMVISTAALLLASTALIAYDFTAALTALRESTSVFARVVADNVTAAVQFQDSQAAEDTINSLRAEPSILSACIYTNDRLFTQHVLSGAARCPDKPVSQPENSDVVLAVAPIQLNGREIGTVQLHASLTPAYAHLRVEIVTITAILAIAALFALGLSTRLHKFVSEPILNLANTAHEVSRRRDYSIRAAKDNDDELGMLVKAFNDMLSEIQTGQNDLQERTAELLQANRMKDEFLATLSHELRTPLNSILGWSVLVQQGGLPGDRQKAALEAIERNARMQARLIEDLLDVSRIISGKFTIDNSVVGLKQIIEGAIEVIRPAAEAKHIHLEFDKPAETIRIAGDAARLQQATWNLLANAVKFTPDEGNVTVQLEKNANHARIVVTDSGIGISQEFLPYVFDRFRQADGSSTRRHGGLGLGLAIVRHIVEMHGGTVSVVSRGKGHGSTFLIELPIAVSQEGAEAIGRRPA